MSLMLLILKRKGIILYFWGDHSPREIKGAVGSPDVKIGKSALLFWNHHNFLNTTPIYTE